LRTTRFLSGCRCRWDNPARLESCWSFGRPCLPDRVHPPPQGLGNRSGWARHWLWPACGYSAKTQGGRSRKKWLESGRNPRTSIKKTHQARRRPVVLRPVVQAHGLRSKKRFKLGDRTSITPGERRGPSSIQAIRFSIFTGVNRWCYPRRECDPLCSEQRAPGSECFGDGRGRERRARNASVTGKVASPGLRMLR